MLTGTEVKSVRAGRVSLQEGFAKVEKRTGELWLRQVDIAPYPNAPAPFQHEPKRPRKLLAHRRQLDTLAGQVSAKGMTLVPLSMYFNERGVAKVELAVASGKQKADKRAAMKEKEAEKEMRRAMVREKLK